MKTLQHHLERTFHPITNTVIEEINVIDGFTIRRLKICFYPNVQGEDFERFKNRVLKILIREHNRIVCENDDPPIKTDYNQ